MSKRERENKRTPMEQAVAHGLQAERPFQMEARFNGESSEDWQTLREENHRLAKKEIFQVYHNS